MLLVEVTFYLGLLAVSPGCFKPEFVKNYNRVKEFILCSGNLTGESVMHWLQEQKMESQIRQVTGQMMRGLVEGEEFVVAMFLKDCDRQDSVSPPHLAIVVTISKYTAQFWR